MTLPWSEWGNLTRFLESARVAFARERNLWRSLEIADREAVTITTTTEVPSKSRSFGTR